MNPFRKISTWLMDVFRVWRRQFHLVFTDPGVLIFFFVLPTVYPIVYSLIYNPEVVKEMPVAVVDNSRTARSRELVRMLDATEAISIYDYATDMPAARRMMNSHDVVAVFEIPSDFDKRLGRGEQAYTNFYSQMDLLLRYRTFVGALADIQIAYGAKVQAKTVDDIGLLAQGMNETPLNSESIMLGDPTQGFASFIMPGIVVLILQQSIVLGICMLMGGHRERLRRNGGIDPQALDVAASSELVGQLLMVITIYYPLVYYILHIVMRIFSFPHVGDQWQMFSFIVPFIVASVFFGRCVAQFVRDRESSFLVVVFTSVVFLFLSGLTWPHYAMNGFWRLVGDFIPATWGVQGFININSDGATVADAGRYYGALWGLAALYFALSWLFARLVRTRSKCPA